MFVQFGQKRSERREVWIKIELVLSLGPVIVTVVLSLMRVT